MSENLDNYLSTLKCLYSTETAMGTIPMRITAYLGSGSPPIELVSSARAIVYRDNQILVISQESGHLYILPGGRLEENENPLDALHREVLEETGWMITDIQALGCIQLHHLGEKPPSYKYPYPDSFWPIFTARAVEYKPEQIIPDDWVDDSEFRDIAEVRNLPLDKGELLLLEEALRLIK